MNPLLFLGRNTAGKYDSRHFLPQYSPGSDSEQYLLVCDPVVDEEITRGTHRHVLTDCVTALGRMVNSLIRCWSELSTVDDQLVD
jgi:hypothetical protein